MVINCGEKIMSIFRSLYIYNNLTWKAHIEYLCKKLSVTSYLFMKLRHDVDITILINEYNGLVYLNLHFSIINWGKANPTTLQELNNQHKRILRIINFSDYQAPFTSLHCKYNIVKITNI